ncbi:MucBP domain-containing protein [Streptococcus merionis]|uniref:MucBP domain-containing protein n=1 Tax=Streptococcus merionis TaxID=400065 RepID=UPI00351982DC
MKKTANPFTMKQRFSLRKYHFGVVSVILGASLLVANPAQAEEATTPSTEQVGEETQSADVTTTSEATASSESAEATEATSETAETSQARETESVAEEASLAASEATATSKTITPTQVTMDVIGVERQTGNLVTDGSGIVDGTVLRYDFAVDLPDAIVNAGDTMTLELPNTVALVTTPQTIEIKDANDVLIGILEVVNNRDANGTFINTTGLITFTDAFTGRFDNQMKFSLNVRNSSHWENQAFEEQYVLINGEKVSSDINLQLYISTSTVFSTSNRLFDPVDYTFKHQSEVGIRNRDEATTLTVIYSLKDNTLPYARYDVEAIRTQGYNIRIGTARNSITIVNTLNNDLGITAEVDDAGTYVILTIPNLPAGYGLNGGSIPVDLTGQAVLEQYKYPYNAQMAIYSTPLGTEADLENGTPLIVNAVMGNYPFSNNTASSNTTAIIVRHVDRSGNELAVSSATPTLLNVDYTTSPVAITGYRNVEVPANATGTVTSREPVVVTYVYDKIGGDVVVNFQDESGNAIKDTVVAVTDEIVGADYDTSTLAEERITTTDGKVYELVAVPANATGQVSEDETQVTYTYKEVLGSVLVAYKDTAGNDIQPAVEATAETSIGTAYDVTNHKLAEIITADGKTYRLVEVQGSETGQVTEGTTTVTYVYEEVLGAVVVNFVDQAGNPLQAPVTVLSDASTGTAYDTTAEKVETLVIDGKTYRLVEVQGSETGQVTEGTTTVTYVYELVAEPQPEPQPIPTPNKDNNRPYLAPTNYQPVDTLSVKHNVKKANQTSQATLPETGESDSAVMTALGMIGLVAGFGLARKKRHQ